MGIIMNFKLSHLAGMSLAAGAFVALTLDAAPVYAQGANCPAAVTGVMNNLRINPKAVLPRDIRLACIRTGDKPALASRNLLQRFIVANKIKPGPVAPKSCGDALLLVTTTAGMPAGFATLPNIGTACKNAKERPALAARNFSHRFVLANKVDAMPAADANLAKSCPGRITAISKALRLNPKFANAKDIATACQRGKGRPVLAMRNYLDRFVVTAKIAPSVLKASGAPAGCPGAVTQVSKILSINPKAATPREVSGACNSAKGRPALAASRFLNRFIAKAKITAAKPAPANIAKSCPGRLMAVSKTLRLNPKFANPKDVATACRIAKGKPALASRNFLGRFIKVNNIK